jgi:hypothetical protein
MTRFRLAVSPGLALLLLAGCTSGTSGGPSADAPRTTPGRTTSSSPPLTGRPGPPRISRTRVLPWQLPGPLSRSVAMRIGPRVLLAGGLEPGDHSTGQVLTLDLAHGVVGHHTSLAEPLHDSAGAVLAGHPTVIGGGGTTELSVVQRQDARHRWHITGRLPEARSDLSVIATADGGFVIGGYDGQTSPTEILRTTRGRQFEVVGTLPTGLRYGGVAYAGTSLWILGGEVDGHELDEVLRFDLVTGKVHRAGRMPGPLGHEAVVAVGTRLLVMGGRTSPTTVTDRMWWFDTTTRTWKHAGRLPYPVADAPWVTQGTSVFLFGGETPDFTSRVTRVTWRP